MEANLLAYVRQKSLFERLEVTANNVANQNASGFKKELAVYMPTTSTIDGKRNPAPTMLVSTDLSPGEFTTTGRSLDVAIQGDGFFEVESPLGARYTRGGSFQIDAEGNLVTNQGYPVVGDGGPIAFAADDRDVKIAENGEIFAYNADNELQLRGTLGIVRFEDRTGLVPAGDNLYMSDIDGEAALPITDFKVAQGMLETSNVKPVEQINELIKINRYVSQTVKMISDQNDLMRNTVSRLSRIDG